MKAPIVLWLALASVVGVVVAELYARGHFESIGWLDGLVSKGAYVLAPYLDTRSEFAKQLEASLRREMPELAEGKLAVHILSQAVPLPPIDSDEFDWHVSSRWCNTVPSGGGIYLASQYRVDHLYRDFLHSIQYGSEFPESVGSVLGALDVAYEEEIDLLKTQATDFFQERLIALRLKQRDLVARLRESVDATPQSTEAQALYAYHNPASSLGMVGPSGRYAVAKRCDTVPDLANWLRQSRTTKAGFLLAEGPASFYLSEAGVETGRVNVTVGAIGSGGSPAEADAVARHTPLALRIQRGTVVDFDRSSWFDEAVLSVDRFASAAEPLLIRDVGARRVPVGLIVVYNPRFTLSVRGDLAVALERLETAGGVISAGPLRMQVGTEELDARIQKLDDRTAHIFYAPDRAYVLGVVSKRVI